MNVSEQMRKDRAAVRELAKRAAEIAALPEQNEKRELWRRLNDLQPVRPMVLIYGIPWGEMGCESLAERTEDPFYREQERYLRRLLFRWDHARGDMVVEPFINCFAIINDTGCGFPGWVDERLAERIIFADKYEEIAMRSFKPMIRSECDLENFKMPVISVDEDKTREYYEKTGDLYDGIFDVRYKIHMSEDFWPWNSVIAWLGIEESLAAMIERPQLIHKIMRRVVDAKLCALEQYERMNLLSYSSGNNLMGGYAYTGDLPTDGNGNGNRNGNGNGNGNANGNGNRKARLSDIWCSAAAEIFTCVSPEMHEEFTLDYENEVLSKFGLTYYGCCERLDNKIHNLERIKNLRKISVSAWSDPYKAAELIGRRYVYSYKPDNTPLSSISWDMEHTRAKLLDVVAAARRNGCPIEIIANAVTTVRNEPRRIFEWADMAQRIAEA